MNQPMSWEEAIREIRSPGFDFNLNVLSSMDLFMKALRNEPAVTQALRQLTEQPELRHAVLETIREMTQEEISPEYENPHDTPLTAMLWLLSATQPELALEAAGLIAQTPGCFYAAKLAHQVILQAR